MRNWFTLLSISLIVGACEPKPDTARFSEATVLGADEEREPSAEELEELAPPLPHAYEGSDEDFRIRFPGKPSEESERIETESGTIEIHKITFDYSSTKAYWVSYSDYPSEMFEGRNSRELLELAKQYVIRELGEGTELGAEGIRDIESNPGVFFKAQSGNFHAVYQLVLVANRLFQVGILRDGRYPSDEDIQQFFGSFDLFLGPNS
jgi:hypothetical protein